jgi:hypothetical protein
MKKSNVKGKAATQARQEAKAKRREKRKTKLNAQILDKLKPLVVKMGQLQQQLRMAQRSNNEREEGQDK